MNNNNGYKIGVTGIVVLSIMGFLIILGIGLKLNSRTPQGNSNLEQVYTQNFTKACVDGGGNESYCGCVLDSIKAKYTIDQMVKLDEDYAKTSQFTPEVLGMVDNCIAKNYK